MGQALKTSEEYQEILKESALLHDIGKIGIPENILNKTGKLTDEEYSELFGHPVDPVFEIYENSLILWSADLEEPVHVDKYCSSLDVMPTLANLFGLEYDSRLMAGRDILSDEPGLVIFSNYSFLTDLGAYNSTTDVFTMWDGSEPDPDYVAERVAEVQNRVAYSASILDNDYYRVLFGPPES